MRTLIVDYETYFDKEYTLDKLTTEEYLRDQRFEAQVLCAKWADDDGEPIRNGKETIEGFLAGIDWENTAVLAHHAAFDVGILSWRYGIRPRAILCSMSMARFVYGPQKRASLGALAERMGLGGKTVPYQAVKGLRWGEMPDPIRRQLISGCARDVDLTQEVYRQLRPKVPPIELNLIDMTIRMFTEPRLNARVDELVAYSREEEFKRDVLLRDIGATLADFTSNEKFAALLQKEGVEVPMKDGKHGMIPAVASSDTFMKELVEDPNDRFRALAGARLAAKSTIHRTRSERIAGMARRGPLAVYLNYYGAHTSRWSGGDKCNFQNLPRGTAIRHAIGCGRGEAIVIVDASQIEARIVNWLAGQHDVVAWFDAYDGKRGPDPYRKFASQIIDCKPEEVTAEERQLFKNVFLGCGYGMGPNKLVSYLRKAGIQKDLGFCQDAVFGYRRVHHKVKQFWNAMDLAIWHINDPDFPPVLLPTCDELIIRYGEILLPLGALMHYELRRVEDEDGNGRWLMKTKQGWRNIWGGTVVENIVQGVARVQFAAAIVNTFKRTGVRPVLLCHDEGVWVVPSSEAEAFRAVAVEEMRRPIRALAGLPMNASSAIDERYVKPD